MDGSTPPENGARKRAGAPPPQRSARQKELRQRNQGAEPQSWALETVEWLGLCLARLILAPWGPRGRGRLIGWLGRTLGPFTPFVGRINENIDLVRPDYDAATRARIRRGVMANFARTAVEYADLPDLAARANGFTVTGLENLEAAQRANGGRMVVVSAHFGNWEAVRAVAALQDAPLGIIYRAFNNRKMDNYSFGLITACGWPAWRKGAEGSKALFKHIRGGGGAMILVDQRAGGAPQLDFMGRPAETSLAAAQLALKLKAPLLPAAAKRVGDGFDVVFEPPIAPSDPLTMSEDVNRVVASWVDAAPEQWFWLHRRWRRRDKKRDALRRYGRSADDERDAS